jgi:hypothetical protein
MLPIDYASGSILHREKPYSSVLHHMALSSQAKKCNNYGPQGDICTTCRDFRYYYGKDLSWTRTPYHS